MGGLHQHQELQDAQQHGTAAQENHQEYWQLPGQLPLCVPRIGLLLHVSCTRYWNFVGMIIPVSLCWGVGLVCIDCCCHLSVGQWFLLHNYCWFCIHVQKMMQRAWTARSARSDLVGLRVHRCSAVTCHLHILAGWPVSFTRYRRVTLKWVKTKQTLERTNLVGTGPVTLKSWAQHCTAELYACLLREAHNYGSRLEPSFCHSHLCLMLNLVSTLSALCLCNAWVPLYCSEKTDFLYSCNKVTVGGGWGECCNLNICLSFCPCTWALSRKYLLNCSPFCNQTWCDGASMRGIVSFENNWLLSLRSRSQWGLTSKYYSFCYIFWIKLNLLWWNLVCWEIITWKCSVKMLDCCVKVWLFLLSEYLLCNCKIILLQSELVWW